MKVLIVNTYYYPEMIGGAEHSVKKLAEQLNAMGIECAVLCTADKDEDAVVEGVRVYRRRMKKRSRSVNVGQKNALDKLIHRLEELFCPGNAPILAEVMEQFKPDVIHTNGLYDITGVVWRTAKKKGIRVVHTLRDYYLMCPRVQLIRRGQTQRCSHPHPLCRLYRVINRYQTRWVDAVTAPSGNTLELLRSDGYFKTAQAKTVVNAIDFDAGITQTAGSKPMGKPFTAIYLGELTPKKGLEWLLQSFSAIEEKEYRLLIAGRGELESRVRVAAEKDPRICYLGFLNEKGVGDALAQADVLICPSIWEEPFGRVVIDAYKHALPVISSNRGALPEIVEDGKTGFVVPAGDIAQLTQAICRYAHDEQLWRSHCIAAAQALDRFSLQNQAKSFMEMYKKS